MHFGRSNTLKDLRGYGLYENNNRAFSENEIEQAIDLASRVRRMLEKSWVPSRSNCGGQYAGKHCVRSRRETVGVAPRGGLQSNWETLSNRRSGFMRRLPCLPCQCREPR